VLTLAVTYIAFGGKFPFYRTPLRLLMCAGLAFIVAMIVAFATLSSV
jgi:hypothetical protein